MRGGSEAGRSSATARTASSCVSTTWIPPTSSSSYAKPASRRSRSTMGAVGGWRSRMRGATPGCTTFAAQPDSVRFFQPRPLLLALDPLDDELLHVGVAGRLDVTRLGRLAVALQSPLLGQLVELRPVDLDQHPLVLAQVLADLRPGQLDPVELDVAATLQLQPEDKFQLLQRRDFRLEALDRGADDVGGGCHRARSCASAKASC